MKKLLLCASATFIASGAMAGQILKSKSGNIETANWQSNFAAQVTPQNNEVSEYILQFKGKVTEAQKKALTGVEIFRYIPDDALLVRMTPAVAQHLATQANVQAVVAYSAAMKMSTSFEPMSVFSVGKYQNILVRTLSDKDAQKVARNLEKISTDVLVISVDGKSMVVQLPSQFISRVANVEGIESVEPVAQMTNFAYDMSDEATPSDSDHSFAGDYSDLTGYESGTKVMNFDKAWSMGLTGKDQVVGMADTGLDSGDVSTIHPFFGADAVLAGHIHGKFSKSWGDPMGHGTHVAGSVLGRPGDTGGRISGGAYDAKISAQSMWSPMMDNLTVPAKLSELFDEAYADGARIHTNSWGNPRNLGAYDAYSQQVDEFMWAHPDMLIVFAAGNSGVDKDKSGRIDAGSVSSPGTAKNTLTVGASKNLVFKGGIQAQIKDLKASATNWPAEPILSSRLSDNIDGLAMFSSRGPTSDNRTKPDLVAPGTNILSSKSQVTGASDLWGAYNSKYTFSGGTSMATPLVAGAAAVTRQYLITNRGFTTPSAALIKATLMATSVDLFPGQFGEVGEAKGQEILNHRPDSDQGYGRVDLSRVVNLTTTDILADEKDGLATGEVREYTVQVYSSNSKLTALMNYTDAPAAASSSKTLVNDLDLEVVTPSGQSVTLNDHTNNAEMVEITKDLAPGTYKIRVHGENIPQGANGKQPFALVVMVR